MVFAAVWSIALSLHSRLALVWEGIEGSFKLFEVRRAAAAIAACRSSQIVA